MDEMMVEAYVSGVSQRKMALQAAIAGLAASSCPSDAGSLPRSPPPASAGPPGSGLRSVPVLAAPRRSSGPVRPVAACVNLHDLLGQDHVLALSTRRRALARA